VKKFLIFVSLIFLAFAIFAVPIDVIPGGALSNPATVGQQLLAAAPIYMDQIVEPSFIGASLPDKAAAQVFAQDSIGVQAQDHNYTIRAITTAATLADFQKDMCINTSAYMEMARTIAYTRLEDRGWP